MRPWWLIELWCSVPELMLGFRLERSFPGPPRLLETCGMLQQLPRVGSHPKGQLLLFQTLRSGLPPIPGTLYSQTTFLSLGVRKE